MKKKLLPKYEFHPLANLFALISEKKLQALTADIKKNGLHHLITLYRGKILDGRNRYKACLAAGVEPRFKEYKGKDPLSFVVSENVQRRQLTVGQRALAAVELVTLKKGRPSRNTSIDVFSQKDAAKLMNIGIASVQRAQKLLEQGNAAKINAVKKGVISLNKALPTLKKLIEEDELPQNKNSSRPEKDDSPKNNKVKEDLEEDEDEEAEAEAEAVSEEEGHERNSTAVDPTQFALAANFFHMELKGVKHKKLLRYLDLGWPSKKMAAAIRKLP